MEENRFINSNMSQKLKYFGHHSDLKRTAIEGMDPVRRGKGQPIERWTQDIKDTICLKIYEARELAEVFFSK